MLYLSALETLHVEVLYKSTTFTFFYLLTKPKVGLIYYCLSLSDEADDDIAIHGGRGSTGIRGQTRG